MSNGQTGQKMALKMFIFPVGVRIPEGEVGNGIFFKFWLKTGPFPLACSTMKLSVMEIFLKPI